MGRIGGRPKFPRKLPKGRAGAGIQHPNQLSPECEQKDGVQLHLAGSDQWDSSLADRMTPRQRKLLLVLEEFWRNWGTPPSVKQLAKAASMSEMVVYEEMRELERQGFVADKKLTVKAADLVTEVKRVQADAGTAERSFRYDRPWSRS